MSAPLTVLDSGRGVWYAMKQLTEGRALTFMACSRGPYGKCTRCGVRHPKEAPAAYPAEGANTWESRASASWLRQRKREGLYPPPKIGQRRLDDYSS